MSAPLACARACDGLLPTVQMQSRSITTEGEDERDAKSQQAGDDGIGYRCSCCNDYRASVRVLMNTLIGFVVAACN